MGKERLLDPKKRDHSRNESMNIRPSPFSKEPATTKHETHKKNHSIDLPSGLKGIKPYFPATT
jgi:hypothetical protein